MASRLASRGASSLARVPTSGVKPVFKSRPNYASVSTLDASRLGHRAYHSSSPVISVLPPLVISQANSQPERFDIRRSQPWSNNNYKGILSSNCRRHKTTNAITGVEGLLSTGARGEDEDASIPYWEKETPEWTIKMLYDGNCPLCMREVNMLRKRNETYRSIAFVDIYGDDYRPKDHAGISFEEAMGRIHAIKRDGTVVTSVEAFRELYEAVGLGFVYAVTKVSLVRQVADVVYDVWAKYRLPITGRPPLAEILEARLRQKGEAPATCRDESGKDMS